MLVKLILKVKQIKSINKIRVVLALLLLPFLFFYQNCGKMNTAKVDDNGNSINSIIPSHQIQMSNNTSCALLSNTNIQAKCWGRNVSGLLGNNGFGVSTPVSVSALSGVKEVLFGTGYLCALTSGNKVECMGANSYGQLGNGGTATSTTLVEVSGLSDVTQIAVGESHSCALLLDQKVKCWGFNGSGQLGNSQIVSGAITPAYLTTPVDVSGLSDVTQISVGKHQSCALLSTKKVKCWGSNGFVQPAITPVDVSLDSSDYVTQIAVGESHSCVLLSSKKVKCWGSNSFGQLGNDSATASTSPVLVLEDVTQIAVGPFHSCALLSTKKVKCWGNNYYGQLGNNSSDLISRTPVPVSLDQSDYVTQISVGYSHSCALLSDQKVKCWGSNSNGQLGNGAQVLNSSFSSTPVDVRDPY